MVHLRSALPAVVVASLSPGSQRRTRERRFKLIHGALSARKVDRRVPWLANLHRISTGALVAVGGSTLVLSALTIHWQNAWAVSYGRLQASKVLEHRMQESSALLEQHHLAAVRRPGQLVPTSSEKLVHLPGPTLRSPGGGGLTFSTLPLNAIPAGY